MRFIQAWRERRAEAEAEHRQLERLFLEFVEETRPLAPKAKKHSEAALYRHAWKRAVVLEVMYQEQSDDKHASLYRKFQEIAGDQYYPVAPSTRYGQARLKLESPAGRRLLELEKKRLLPRSERSQKRRRKPGAPKACVYVGRDTDGKVYVGQTQEARELRWLQHRTEGTGPFKDGDPDIDWKVLEGDVPLAKLDEVESYYIGQLNALEDGYNENRGNDSEAYDRGCAERLLAAR